MRKEKKREKKTAFLDIESREFVICLSSIDDTDHAVPVPLLSLGSVLVVVSIDVDLSYAFIVV